LYQKYFYICSINSQLKPLKMQITIKKETEQTIEFTPPLFWKKDNNVVGLLDDNTVVTAYKSENYSSVQNCNAKVGERDLWIAADVMQPCSELEFFTFLDEVLEIVSLKPVKTEKL